MFYTDGCQYDVRSSHDQSFGDAQKSASRRGRSMVVQIPGSDEVRAAILTEVTQGITSPPQIIETLKDRGMDEDLIRGLIWVLIDQG